MKIIITGGAGFLGRRLTEVLLQRGTVTASNGERTGIESIVWYDQPAAIEAVRAGAPAGVELVGGDITDAAGFSALLDRAEIGIFHLASVVSGQGEQDFDLALRVNLDGTRTVLEAARRHENTPRVVATSSVAVFGPGSGPAGTDQAPPRPGTTYGMTKAILELMFDDYTRKGFLDGRVGRIPTVIIRPGRPNAAASSAASAVFREPLAGRPYAVPLAPETRMAVGGAAGVVAGLADLFELPSERIGAFRTLTFPSVSATFAEMLAAVQRLVPAEALAPVTFEPDPEIQRIVDTWVPTTEGERATALGVGAVDDLEAIVLDYIRREHPELQLQNGRASQ
ncbi:NAD-dependent epimerase/dehydratase family protein [Microlunatus speluncae]|uniref:NAD-dependent epimerase/dehydratase family protein n=1 Tax=Microlunatus speluncae TaxID=2594267 RepID=UPI0013760C76|nr:NAD-dependent epimerase/dehydratase family protein [Microlunatus speluncae]